MKNVDYRDLWSDLFALVRARRHDTIQRAIRSLSMEELAEHRGRAKCFDEIAEIGESLLKAARGDRDEGTEEAEEHEGGMLDG